MTVSRGIDLGVPEPASIATRSGAGVGGLKHGPADRIAGPGQVTIAMGTRMSRGMEQAAILSPCARARTVWRGWLRRNSRMGQGVRSSTGFR